MTYHFLSQTTGDFIGAAEMIPGDTYAELWAESGDVDTLVDTDHAKGDELYKVLIDEFSAELGCKHEDIYLTDEDESEILMAL